MYTGIPRHLAGGSQQRREDCIHGGLGPPLVDRGGHRGQGPHALHHFTYLNFTFLHIQLGNIYVAKFSFRGALLK